MLRTISLKLLGTSHTTFLSSLQESFSKACNLIVPYVVENKCWNRVQLHNLVYDKLRKESRLGSQMVCNAIFAVCKAYKSQKALGKIKNKEEIPKITFNKAAVHFDKRTYTLTKLGQLSLYSLDGRIKVDFTMGENHKKIFRSGTPKEAELIYKKGVWYFQLVIELPDPPKVEKGKVMGVDIGENNLAATSTGKIFGGEKLRHRRDCFLAHRRRLQSNGTQSSKQRLRKVSGREARHVRHINHEVSAAIIAEAKRAGASLIVLEDLKDIRERIRANKRIRSRLHRWPFRQLQQFICYKAENVGIEIQFVNPAYTSLTCSKCLILGERKKHQFKCTVCGLLAHADINSSRNLAGIAVSADIARARVNGPNVDASRVP